MILINSQFKISIFAAALAAFGLTQVALAVTPCEPQAAPVSFQTSDGVTLRGEILSPCGSQPQDRLPAVLFMNPFGQSFESYKIQAAALVEEGYRTLSYDPRGWQTSDGQTSLDYAQLTGDASRSLDWLTSHYVTTRIGATGISEGGGLSLLLAAADSRVTSAASLSGWTDIDHPSLGGTDRLAWNLILQTMLVIFGDPTALIEEVIKQASSGAASSIDVAAQSRSMSAWYRMKDINARKVPVMLSHSLDDTLFPVNQIFDFYKALEGPRHLQVNRGFHAAKELTGVLDPSREPWVGMRQWFGAYVKDGKASALDQVVRIAYKNQDETLELPSEARLKAGKRIFYGASTANGYELKDAPVASVDQASLRVEHVPWEASGVSTGIPVLSALSNLLTLSTVKVPVADLQRPYGLAFVSTPLVRQTTVFGTARATFSLSSASDQGMMVAHLVDVAPDGSGELMSHGVYTWSARNRDASGQLRFDVELYATAWRLAAGHRMALVIDGFDAEYAPPTLSPYEYTLDDRAGSLRLEVQLLDDAAAVN